MGGRTAGGRGLGEIRKGKIKYFPVVGDVQPYGGVYQGGIGVYMGAGESGEVWHV